MLWIYEKPPHSERCCHHLDEVRRYNNGYWQRRQKSWNDNMRKFLSQNHLTVPVTLTHLSVSNMMTSWNFTLVQLCVSWRGLDQTALRDLADYTLCSSWIVQTSWPNRFWLSSKNRITPAVSHQTGRLLILYQSSRKVTKLIQIIIGQSLSLLSHVK